MSCWTRNEWIEDAKERVLRNTKRTDDYESGVAFYVIAKVVPA